MKYAFTKAKRLLDKKEYEKVFKKSKKIDMPTFFALVSLNDQSNARMGFAISKKHLPRASERNRVKRIFRESFRHEQLKNIDLVVLAKPGLAQLSNHEIRLDLQVLWQRINILV